MAKFSIHFNLKDKKSDYSLVILVMRYSEWKTPMKVSTHAKIRVSAWDFDKERCIASDYLSDRENREVRRVNRVLDKLENDLSQFYKNYPIYFSSGPWGESPQDYAKFLAKRIRKGEILKLEEIENKKNIKPLDFFEQYVENMTKKINKHTGDFVAVRTQNHHKTVLKRIKEFFRYENLPNEFSVFNKKFEDKLTFWGFKVKNYANNTIPATFSILKVWLNSAREEGLIDNLDYTHYTSKAKEVDNIYLTKEEIERIYQLDIASLMKKGEIDDKSKIEATRDLFVIACWTGLRQSDIRNINDKAFFDIEKENITILTQKTKEKVVIPLHPFLKEIYLKYEGNFPRLVDKAHLSVHLQELGRHAEVNDDVLMTENRGGKTESHIYKKYQLIKVHTSRRSFATNLYLEGAPTISIMKLTGHTTEANFLKYIKITKEENAEMMRKFFL